MNQPVWFIRQIFHDAEGHIVIYGPDDRPANLQKNISGPKRS